MASGAFREHQEAGIICNNHQKQALHADGRSDGGKYCDDKIDDLLDGFFSHGLMIY